MRYGGSLVYCTQCTVEYVLVGGLLVSSTQVGDVLPHYVFMMCGVLLVGGMYWLTG